MSQHEIKTSNEITYHVMYDHEVKAVIANYGQLQDNTVYGDGRSLKITLGLTGGDVPPDYDIILSKISGGLPIYNIF
jgi:hypothetical protein